MLSVFIPIETALLRFVALYHSIFLSDFVSRFSVSGSVNLFIVVGSVFLYYFKFKQFSMIAWCLTFLITLYPLSWRVSYLDVGQGDATLIQSPLNSYTILIDTGQPFAFYQLKNSLTRYGVDRIDTLIITHDDADHVGNLDRLVPITDRVVREKGDTVPFLQSYLDDKTYNDINENSLVYSLRTRRTIFLFMGDAGRIAEVDFIRENPLLKVDILKLGHHGSRTSTSEGLLATLEARYAIISSRLSTYGHPHPEVMRSLYRFRVKPILTADSGNIRIVSGILFDYVLTDAFGFGIIR